GGRSAPEGGLGGGPRPLDNSPVAGSRSETDWTEGCGPLPTPRQPGAGYFLRVLLRLLAAAASGVVLSLAFEPVAAPIVVPFAVAGFVLCCRGLRLRSGWIPGLAFGIGFQYVLIVWMRAVGT